MMGRVVPIYSDISARYRGVLRERGLDRLPAPGASCEVSFPEMSGPAVYPLCFVSPAVSASF